MHTCLQCTELRTSSGVKIKLSIHNSHCSKWKYFNATTRKISCVIGSYLSQVLLQLYKFTHTNAYDWQDKITSSWSYFLRVSLIMCPWSTRWSLRNSRSASFFIFLHLLLASCFSLHSWGPTNFLRPSNLQQYQNNLF